MKVLYIVSTLRDTGPVNQLYGIIHNLNREEIIPHILTLSEEPQNSKKELFEEDGVEVESLRLSRLEFMIYGKKRLKKALARIAPDLIHTNGIRADIAMSRMNIKTPICSTIRNYVYEDYIPLFGKAKGTVMGICHENAIKKMKYPVCCSKTLKKKYMNHIKRDFFVIQNGVDVQRYYVTGKEDIRHIRERLKLPLNKKVIIVVGDLIERKDPLTIIKAVEQMQKEAKFLVIFIGGGMLRERLQKFESEYINFLGHKTNVSEYFQAADVFISASRSEGLPNTVLEAGASGVAMILSDIPQHREIFEKETISGVDFFHVGDVHQLAEKIRDSLNNYENDSRLIISDYIKENFDSKVMSWKYQDFYWKCIENTRDNKEFE